jgi:uncharacterized protein YndB with AHSA1/START domain
MTIVRTEPVSVSRRIEAPAAAIFAILADPARHPDLDGSRMLCEAVDPRPVGKTGDTFVMRMNNKFMGDYVMANYIAEFEQDRRISWEPELVEASREEDRELIGVKGAMRWSYELVPDGENATVVTEIYDCSGASEERQQMLRGGEVWRNGMKRSLESLDRLSTAG